MKFNSNQGFSLLPLIIALGSAVAVGYYIVSQQDATNRMHVKTLLDEAVETASAPIKTNLADIETCTKNFTGRGHGYEPEELYNKYGQIIARKNQKYPLAGEIELIKMEIQPYKDPTTGITSDYLYVTYNVDPLDRKIFFGSNTYGKKFRLRGQKISDKYIFCYHEESNVVELSAKDNCIASQGTWDAVTWNCVIDPTEYVDPTPISCTNGYQIASVDGVIKVVCTP